VPASGRPSAILTVIVLLPCVSTPTEMRSPFSSVISRVSAVPADSAGMAQQPPQATMAISRMT
jgi:hypothetical protein